MIDLDKFFEEQGSVLRLSRASMIRSITVTLVVMSWLALSNHCALGLAMVESHQMEQPVEHDCCASTVPPQPKPGKTPAAPCCKMLRIVAVMSAQVAPMNSATFVVLPRDLAPAIDVLGSDARLLPHFLDTGPPGAASFAESILQRSLLAHAPPVLS